MVRWFMMATSTLEPDRCRPPATDLAPMYEHICQQLSWPVDAAQLAALKAKNEERLSELDAKIKVRFVRLCTRNRARPVCPSTQQRFTHPSATAKLKLVHALATS